MRELAPNGRLTPLLYAILRLPRFQIDPGSAKVAVDRLPYCERLSPEAKNALLEAIELDLLASDNEITRDICKKSSAACFSKAAETQLRTIFEAFREIYSPSDSKELTAEAKLSETGGDSFFYKFLVNGKRLTLGDMLKAMKKAGASALNLRALRDFRLHLGAHYPKLLLRESLIALSELRDIGNDHRHNFLPVVRAANAKELAAQALQAMLPQKSEIGS